MKGLLQNTGKSITLKGRAWTKLKKIKMDCISLNFEKHRHPGYGMTVYNE